MRQTSLKSILQRQSFNIHFFVYFQQLLPALGILKLVLHIYYGMICNPEKISCTLDTMFTHFNDENFIKFRLINVQSQNSGFCIFIAIFAYFQIFILIEDPQYGVIWNPEIIFYMLDTNILNSVRQASLKCIIQILSFIMHIFVYFQEFLLSLGG